MSGKLGDILVSHGVIDQEKLIAALSDQFAFGGKLGRTLIDLGYVSEEELLRALSEQLGLDTVDLDAAEVKTDALRRLPFDACERYGVFPLSERGGASRSARSRATFRWRRRGHGRSRTGLRKPTFPTSGSRQMPPSSEASSRASAPRTPSRS